MYQTITVSDFRDAFRSYGRMDNFSYDGLEVLFDYLEDIDPDLELDVIALCCEYSEDPPENIAAQYNIDLSGIKEDDEEDRGEAVKDCVLEYLHENTTVCGVTRDGDIVYAQF